MSDLETLARALIETSEKSDICYLCWASNGQPHNDISFVDPECDHVDDSGCEHEWEEPCPMVEALRIAALELSPVAV